MTAGHHANGVTPTGWSFGSPVSLPVIGISFIGGFSGRVLGHLDIFVVVVLPLVGLISAGRGPPF